MGIPDLHSCLRTIWLALAGLLFTVAGAAAPVSAATIDWASLGVANLAAVPASTTVTGSDGNVGTLTWSTATNGGVAPTYPNYLVYYSGQIGTITSQLLFNFNNVAYDPTDKVTAEVSMATAVTGLSFKLTDIDSGTFVDAVEVYYDTGNGTWQNAAATAAFWTAGTAITRTNNTTVNGWRGTANSAQTSAAGELSLNFGTTTVKRIRIVYFSYTGTGDPTDQYMGFGGLTYTTPPPPSYNCPQGSTATGSGYAATGLGQHTGEIFWLDWSCGGTTSFAAGGTINKSWNLGNGLIVTGTVTNITLGISSYSTGVWAGDRLDDLYSGVNPIGLGNGAGQNAGYRLVLSATLNGVTIPLNYVIADAEDTGTSGTEKITVSMSGGSNWQTLENSSALSLSLAGTTASWTGTLSSGNGSAVLQTTGTAVTFNTSIVNRSGEFLAFGIYTPYDYSDAPLTGTSYGSANHRTLPNFGIGAAYTNERTAYDSLAANGDADDGAAPAAFVAGQTIAVPVTVRGAGYLSAWIDFNGDGDFSDAGEQVASDIRDGTAGDADGTVNGTIVLSVAVPAGVTNRNTIARFRYSSSTGTTVSGLAGYGEVEDYQVQLAIPSLSVVKTSTVISDGIDDSNPFSIPGAVVEYCIITTNTSPVPVSNLVATDNLPADVSYLFGTLKSGSTCAAVATAEDDDSIGTDESDPFGAASNGTAVTISTNLLAAGASVAVKFRATVN